MCDYDPILRCLKHYQNPASGTLTQVYGGTNTIVNVTISDYANIPDIDFFLDKELCASELG